MTSPTWSGKAPVDMTLEELQSAKEVLQKDLDDMQAEVAWRSVVNTALSSEILKRYAMVSTPGYVAPEALPAYPSEQVAATYGTAPTSA